MAATLIGDQLTEAHRLAQLRIGAQVALEMDATWALMDIGDLDRSALRWAAVSSSVVRGRRFQSANLAANYLRTFRSAELGLAVNDFSPVLSPSLDPDALMTSLRVTGPVKVKQALSRGLSPTEAMAQGQAASSGAAMRHAMNGGRDTLMGSVQADPRALGYMRVTSHDPCAFCVMLSSRGPVYKSKATAAFQPHDTCSCMPQPVFHRDAPWHESAQRNHDTWVAAQAAHDSTDGLSDAPLDVLRRHMAHT